MAEEGVSWSRRGQWGHVPGQRRAERGTMISRISSPRMRHRGLWLSANPSDFPTGTQWNHNANEWQQFRYREIKNVIAVSYHCLYIITKDKIKQISSCMSSTSLCSFIPFLTNAANVEWITILFPLIWCRLVNQKRAYHHTWDVDN